MSCVPLIGWRAAGNASRGSARTGSPFAATRGSHACCRRCRPVFFRDVPSRGFATDPRRRSLESACRPTEPGARAAVGQMVDEIRLTPRDGVLAIDVKGNLAGMLRAASPEQDWPQQMALVAGAGFEPATFGL